MGQMRLHRHDELVEAMAKAICNHNPSTPGPWQLWQPEATAALDALLEAAVELGVAKIVDGINYKYLSVRMEASDD